MTLHTSLITISKITIHHFHAELLRVVCVCVCVCVHVRVYVCDLRDRLFSDQECVPVCIQWCVRDPAPRGAGAFPGEKQTYDITIKGHRYLQNVTQKQQLINLSIVS